MPIYTSNQFRINVSVAGVKLDSSSWGKFTGGDRTSDTQNYPPGGMEPSVATQGVSKRTPITVERAWDDTLIGAFKSLDNAVNGPVSVSVTPLRTRSTAAGGPDTYSGVLKEVKRPDAETTSSSIAMLSLTIEPNEQMS